MKRKIYKTSAALLLSSLILAGCSPKSLDMAEDAAAGQTVTSNDTGGYNGYMEESKEAFAVDTEMDMEASEDMAEGAGAIAPEVSEKDLSSRKLIKTVSLSMETKTFDALKAQMEESVSSFGGYIENSSYDAPQGGQQYRYYYLCVRVPAGHMDEFVGKAGEMGTITNKSENVESKKQKTAAVRNQHKGSEDFRFIVTIYDALHFAARYPAAVYTPSMKRLTTTTLAPAGVEKK